MSSDLKRHITSLVTVLVVVSFEIIDIDHQKTHRIVVTLRAVQLVGQSLLEITTVRQPRQRVSDRHELKLGGAFLPLSTLERERHLWSNDLEETEIDFVVNSPASLVSHIQHTDFPATNHDWVTDERVCFVPAFGGRSLPARNAEVSYHHRLPGVDDFSGNPLTDTHCRK